MAIYNLTNATTPDGVLIGLTNSVPVFPMMILFFTWMFVLLSGSTRQNSRYGYSDIPQWSVLASVSTLLLALLMTTSAGMISGATLAIVVAITILSGVWFFMSRGRNE
jgi:hypothetical protein